MSGFSGGTKPTKARRVTTCGASYSGAPTGRPAPRLARDVRLVESLTGKSNAHPFWGMRVVPLFVLDLFVMRVRYAFVICEECPR